MSSLPPCPICGATLTRTLLDRPERRLTQCRNCGFAALDSFRPEAGRSAADTGRAARWLRRAGAAAPPILLDQVRSPVAALAIPDAFAGETDPRELAGRLRSAVAPGGYVYLTTPDIGHWRRPRDVERWDAFDPGRRGMFFTPFSLTLLLERHNLRVVRRLPSWRPWIELVARNSI